MFPMDGGLKWIAEGVPYLGLTLELVLLGVDFEEALDRRLHVQVEKLEQAPGRVPDVQRQILVSHSPEK